MKAYFVLPRIEQWHGADPDPRADLYAVGRVALEMLTGVRPSSDPAATDLDALRTGDPSRGSLLDLVARATATDVGARPASATEMRRALATSGLLALEAEPHDTVSVPDRFGACRAGPAARAARGDGRRHAGDRHPRPRTVPDARDAWPRDPPRSGSTGRRPVLGTLLVLAGLVGLVVAIVLVVGA